MKDERTFTVEITEHEWNIVESFLLMTTQYRLGEAAAWEKLSQETNEDGTPIFPKAESNAAFWHDMHETVESFRQKLNHAAWPYVY